MQTKSHLLLFISACITWVYTESKVTEKRLLLGDFPGANNISCFDVQQNAQDPTIGLNCKIFYLPLKKSRCRKICSKNRGNGRKSRLSLRCNCDKHFRDSWLITKLKIHANSNFIGNGLTQIEKDKVISKNNSGHDSRIDPCYGVTCSGKGHCSVIQNQQKCRCNGKYSGDDCEISPCDGITCSGKGSCSVVNDLPVCRCKGNYSGVYCEVSPCSGVNCSGNGNCSVVENQPFCRCKDNYSGVDCEVSPCSGVNCSGNGNCSVVENQPFCRCNNDYIGKNCESNLCSSFPCQNGGICTTVNGSYECSCKSEFTGRYCEKDLKCNTCLKKHSVLAIKSGTSCTEYFADGFMYPCPKGLVFDANMCGCVIQPLAAYCPC